MKAEKQLLLNEVKECIQKSPNFLLMSYQKLNPNDASKLRDVIWDTGGFFYVVKKRIFIKAANEIDISLDRETLQGHLGIVYTGEDPILSTKGLLRFKEEGAGEIEILGGRFEGTFYSQNEVQELAKLPSKDRLRAEFLGVLEAPLSHVVGIMEAALTSIVNCVEGKMKKEKTL